MNREAFVLICLLVPFAGTSLGSLAVFALGRAPRPSVKEVLLGFASGVMMASAVWSLIIPALEMSEAQGVRPLWLPAVSGFLCGGAFLLVTDRLITHLDRMSVDRSHLTHSVWRSSKLFFAVTLHNIPEGMAVGVALAGYIAGDSSVSMAGVTVLCMGIALQNIPEGAIISLPLAADGKTRKRALFYAVMSGVVEPVFGALTLILTAIITRTLPFFLCFAAGAMIYVVVEELIPGAKLGDNSHAPAIGCALGFATMMLLDVALG